MKTHFSYKKSAFTLIELLVVIAIIAILAAILFPVFARARENARRSSCQSNLKQIGLGVLQYTQDYDEFYPMGTWQYNGTSAPEVRWSQSIQPYVKSTQLFMCPSNPNNDQVTSAAVGPYPAINISYAANSHIMRPFNGLPTVNLAYIDQTSTRIMAGELTSNNYDIMNYTWSGNTSLVNNGFAGHLGTWNCLFADGHVKSYRPTQTITPVNMWGRFNDTGGSTECSGQPALNCTVVSPGILTRAAQLEAKYN